MIYTYKDQTAWNKLLGEEDPYAYWVGEIQSPQRAIGGIFWKPEYSVIIVGRYSMAACTPTGIRVSLQGLSAYSQEQAVMVRDISLSRLKQLLTKWTVLWVSAKWERTASET